MKITEKVYPSGNKIIILSPDDNYKYVTNGEIYSTLVYLGKHDSIENWHDTNEEPPIKEERDGYEEN